MLQCWIIHLTFAGHFFSFITTLPLYQSGHLTQTNYNPEENIGVNIFLTEGDILVSREDVSITYHQTYRQDEHVSARVKSELPFTRQKRNADSQYFKTWYNRSVPFFFDASVSTEVQVLIEAAMAGIQNASCIRFRRRNNEKDYIRFIMPSNGCYSPVGRVGGPQDIGLGDGCFAHGTIQHEILHALGLWHEQSRFDRDEYIKVMWDNIPREHHNNFLPRRPSESHEIFLTMPYDYGSLMHYSNNTFAIDRHKPTLIPKQTLPSGVVMGQRLGLSQGDVDKIYALYRCDITNCSQPDLVRDGEIIGTDFSVGASIDYSCNPGFSLIGASERVCRDVGEWSGQSPICLASNQAIPLHYCNFDGSAPDFCGWSQATDEELDWVIQRGPTPSDGTGPNWDHTLSTVYGGYAYVEASNRNPRQKARLVSPVFNLNSSRACLVFFTYMYGSAMGNLSVFMNTSGSYNSVDSNFLTAVSGNQGQQWKQVFLVLHVDNRPLTITIEGSVGNGYESDIAIDDIVIGDCNFFKPLALMGGLPETTGCNFDYGLCQFVQDKRDNIDWTLNVGKTATFDTGPDCDPFDCQGGQYLYIEASRPRGMGNRARLRTPVLRGQGGRCISFYYHMYGEHIGSLTVKMTSIISGSEQILWAASGNQGNRWHSQHVDFLAPEVYEISFDGTVGPSYKGDIAIDKINVTLGRCAGLLFDCNFEHDLCGWMNAPGDRLDWIRHTGETDSPDTGPLSDRTNLDGYFLYVESSRTIVGDTARLVSPVVNSSPFGHCLLFWYHMYGASTGNLTVSYLTNIGQEEVLWSQTGNQGNQWRSQQVNITSTGDYNYNIIFEATMAGFTGDVAIDDISIQNSLCGS